MPPAARWDEVRFDTRHLVHAQRGTDGNFAVRPRFAIAISPTPGERPYTTPLSICAPIVVRVDREAAVDS